MDRRLFLTTALGGAVTSARAFAQAAPTQQVSPVPTPRDWDKPGPIAYPDPDIIALDPRFRRYIVFNTSIKRLHIGTEWAEGPAWNGVGKYLVWSDIPNNSQLRWIDDDGRVTLFRRPSNHSNGNTFDYEGRQLSCEHSGRRVARYEPNGTVTTVADKYQGKRLNSPNDAVVHPDGSIWFTDPSYGIRGNFEGFRAESETKEAVYRVDGKSGQIAMVTDEVGMPNGLCFSPDYTKLYVADTGMPRDVKVWDVNGQSLRNGKRFAQLDIPGNGCAVGRRRHPLRRRRQHLGGRAARRPGAGAQWRPHRHDSPARDLRQRLLWRPSPKPPLHDSEPEFVFGFRGNDGCAHRVITRPHRGTTNYQLPTTNYQLK